MREIGAGDRVVTAWAEKLTGAGWSNEIIWVLVCGRDQSLRVQGIQPEQPTQRMLDLVSVSDAASTAMTRAVLQDLAIRREKEEESEQGPSQA